MNDNSIRSIAELLPNETDRGGILLWSDNGEK